MMTANPDRLVFAATDAVSFLDRMPFPLGDELGALEESHYLEFFLAQAGIYQGVHEEKGEIERSRGFFLKDLDFGALRQLWRDNGRWGIARHTTRRFIGAGTALLRSDFESWRRWEDREIELQFMSATKWYADNRLGAKDGKIAVLYPEDFDGVFPGESEPYLPKKGLLDIGYEDQIYVQGLEQPDLLEV
jgi:hypothetical protein